MLSASSFRELIDAPLSDLAPAAAARRDARTGRRITFSPKVFVPLTMLCRDRCGYCTFAKPPARLESPYLSLDEVLAIARAGASQGCHEALFTLGEAPEDRYPSAGELAAELRVVMGEPARLSTPVPVVPPAWREPVSEGAAPGAFWGRVLLVAAALVLLALVIARYQRGSFVPPSPDAADGPASLPSSFPGGADLPPRRPAYPRSTR